MIMTASASVTRPEINIQIQRPDGSFLIEDKLTLKFPGAKASVRRNGDKAELLVPVIFSGNQAQLVEEFSW